MMVKLFLALLSAICVVSMGSAVAAEATQAETRVALVIGNSTYERASRLTSPAVDAAEMGQALRRSGFSIVLVRNDLSKSAMEAALREFGALARNADVALIYYSGHGIEVGGRNYLIPTDARLASDADVELDTVAMDRFLDAAGSAKKLKLVFIDACRENPFLTRMQRTLPTRSMTRGLIEVPPRPGMVISFAAGAGQVARDGKGAGSPFTQALLKHMAEPGEEIGFLLRKVRDTVMEATENSQEPAVYSALGGARFYFIAPPPSPPAIDTEPTRLITLQAAEPYCTGALLMVGLSYSPSEPEIVTVSQIAIGPTGQAGEGCTKVDHVHGVRRIATIKLPPSSANLTQFNVTALFLAKVEGDGCETIAPTPGGGYRHAMVTLNVHRSFGTSTYITGGAILPDGAKADATVQAKTLDSMNAALEFGRRTPGLTLRATSDSEGIFGRCTKATVPKLTILAAATPFYH